MEHGSEPKYLSIEEFRLQLNKLSLHGVAKVLAVARLKYVSGSKMTDDELLAEAVARVLEGSRNIPRNIPLVASLIEIIRSISSIERDKVEKQKDYMGLEVPLESNVEEVSLLQSAHLSPDKILEESQEAQYRESILTELENIVADDPYEKAYLNGKLNGLTANEVIHKTGITPKDYGAARKRVTRALLRLKPKRN